MLTTHAMGYPHQRSVSNPSSFELVKQLTAPESNRLPAKKKTNAGIMEHDRLKGNVKHNSLS